MVHKSGEIKEEWAKFIISQALMEIKTEKDIPKVIAKVEGTAIGVRPDLMERFLSLVESKRTLLKHMGR
jgi:hypothetical protein